MSNKEVRTSGPTTAAIMSKLGLITVDTRNLPSPDVMFEHLFGKGISKIDFAHASQVLKTPESTVRRWYSNKAFPSMAIELLTIRYRGYLPYTNTWKKFYFDTDENLVTPFGIVTPGQLVMFHKIKWRMERQHEELRKLKATLDSEFQRTKQKALAQKMEELQKLINAQSESEIKRLGDDSANTA